MILQHNPAKNRAYYLFGNFPSPDVICGFSTRIAGNMSLFYGDTAFALENRRNFLQDLSVDYRNLVCAKQVHASKVVCVQEADTGRGALSYDSAIPDTDALITDKKNAPLSIFTADCPSVFLYDPRLKVIGILHAGWRSSKQAIAAKTVELMRDKFNTRPRDLCAAFGPAIRACCYEVGKEFSGLFAPEYLSKRNGRYYLDLIKANKEQLLSLGLKDKNIFDPGFCTVCRNDMFFSYRKEGSGCGRAMSVIMLK